MQLGARRRAISRNGVMAGSVWETRMKMDEVKGGIKVFNAAGESHDDEEGLKVYRRLRRKQSDGGEAEKKKRKSWKQSEAQRSPIQIRKAPSIEIGCKRGAEEKGVLVLCDAEGNEKEMDEEQRNFDDKEMDLPVEKEKKMEEVKKIEIVHEMQSSPSPRVVIEKKAFYARDLEDKDPDPVALREGEEEEEEEEDDDEEKSLFETNTGNSNRMQHIGL